MVGKIHPVSPSTEELPFFPVYELVFVLWERYRGGKQWGKVEIVDHCPVCKHITEWVVDLLWEKWNRKSFVPFGVFIHHLINTDIYDWHMKRVTPEKMKALPFFCYGVSADLSADSHVDAKFIYRIKGLNL